MHRQTRLRTLCCLALSWACGGAGASGGALGAAGGAAGCMLLTGCGDGGASAGHAGEAAGGSSSGGAAMGGEAGSSEAGSSGQGGSVDGCVDLWIDGKEFDQTLSSSATPRTPFWLDQNGAHVPWVMLPNTQAIVLSTVPWTDPMALHHDLYSVFPAAASPAHSGFFDAVGEPGGKFAVDWGYLDKPGTSTIQGVMLGDSGDAAAWSNWAPSAQWYPAVVFHMGWDGEAFALHLRSSETNDLLLARLSSKGELLRDVSRAGELGSVAYNESDFRTEADSGMSWMVFNAPSGVKITGHDREGNVAAALGATGELIVTPDGADMPAQAGAYPALAVGPAGLFLVWTDSDSTTWLQGLDEGLASRGPAIAIPPEQLGDPKRFPASGLKDKAAYVLNDKHYVAASNQHTVELFVATESELTKRWTIVNSSRADDCLTNLGCDLLSIRSLMIREWQGELWLGFLDYSENNVDNDPAMLPFQSAYRIVKVREGCSYKTLYDIRRGL